MSLARLARPVGLAAVLAAFLGIFAATATDVRAVTVVATLVSGGTPGPAGTPDPAVEFRNAVNVWTPAAVTNQLLGTYAPALPGSLYIDAPAPTGALTPNPVIFRTPFKLPQGCITPKLTIDLHADNWADVFLNGPVPPVAANFVGGQPPGAIFANFQGPPDTFTAPPPATFINPGLNWLYIVVENAGGQPSAGNPRALDFRAVVTCEDIITTPPPTLVYECFELTQGQDPNKVVQLDTDNFGKDIVTVRTSRMMCESAYKYRQLGPGEKPKPPALNAVLQCFRLQNGQDPNDPAILDTQNFGPNTVQIRTSRQMCESATKLMNGAVKSQGGTDIWQCFAITNGVTPNAQVILSTNNFGPHHAIVGKAVMMCESAKKVTSSGQVFNADHKGEVFQCFRLIETPILNVPAILITKNFLTDDVRIRRANLMCEPAEKTIIFHNPNEPAPTDATDATDN